MSWRVFPDIVRASSCGSRFHAFDAYAEFEPRDQSFRRPCDVLIATMATTAAEAERIASPCPVWNIRQAWFTRSQLRQVAMVTIACRAVWPDLTYFCSALCGLGSRKINSVKFSTELCKRRLKFGILCAVSSATQLSFVRVWIFLYWTTFIHRKTVEVRTKYKTIQWQYEKQKNNTTYSVTTAATLRHTPTRFMRCLWRLPLKTWCCSFFYYLNNTRKNKYL